MELMSLAPNEVLDSSFGAKDTAKFQQTLDSTNPSVQRNAARCYGIVSSLSGHTGFEGYALGALVRIEQWQQAVGQDVIKLRGLLLSVTFGITRKWLRGLSFSDEVGQKLTKLMITILSKSKDRMLKDVS